MLVELEDEILVAGKISIEDLRLGIALWLFQEKNVALGKCAELAGMHKIQFQRELAKRRIPVHYDEEDLQRDMRAAQNMS
jgi:predicted HTH domain antitoxin